MLSRRAPPTLHASVIPNTRHFPGSTCWQVTNVCKFSANSHFSRLSSFSLSLLAPLVVLLPFHAGVDFIYNSVAHDKRISWPNLLHAPMQSGEKRKEPNAGAPPFNCLSRHAENVSTDDKRREREPSKNWNPFFNQGNYARCGWKEKDERAWGEKERYWNSRLILRKGLRIFTFYPFNATHCSLCARERRLDWKERGNHCRSCFKHLNGALKREGCRRRSFSHSVCLFLRSLLAAVAASAAITRY